jgi:nucleoside-diphosphate-sugar epimerase
MASKTICGITGASGILGSEFIKKKYFNFIKFRGDITNKKHINEWLCANRFDLIIHFAAIVPTNAVRNHYKEALKVNFIGTKYLIDSIIKNKINLKWFFFASTSHVYSFSKKKIDETSLTVPISKYGHTKLKAEKYINDVLSYRGVNYCIGRIFSFTHKNQKSSFLIPSIKNKIKKNKKKLITFEDLNHYRDFISTKEICDIIYFLWKIFFCGTINIASGQKLYLKKIARFLSVKYKKKTKFLDLNKSTSLIANTSKINSLGWKIKKMSISNIIN